MEADDYLLATIGSVILGLQAWVVFEGLRAVRRHEPVPKAKSMK